LLFLQAQIKNRKQKMKKMLIIVLVISISYCFAQPKVNLSQVKEEIVSYYESGKIEKEYEKAIQKMQKQLDLQIKNSKGKNNVAVVFDIDETILSNYPHMKMLDFGYIPELWDKWVDEAKAPVIKPTKKLYDYLVNKNIKIIFITGRYADQYEKTKKNLNDLGIENFDTIITKSRNGNNITTGKYKEQKREELVKKGYQIIACVGDQWSDMEGKNTGIKIKLPNYIYIIK
jgi:5'-nucleotidase (lipoprotein e(P4) family)